MGGTPEAKGWGIGQITLSGGSAMPLGSYGQAWKEDQVIELFFEDKTKTQLPYVNFVSKYGYVKATVMSSSVDEVTKDLTLKVKREDNGAEVTIGVTFIN